MEIVIPLIIFPMTALSILFLLDISQYPDIGTLIQQLSNQFVSSASKLLLAIDNVVFQISRLVYITVLLIGVLLYFTRVHKRFGKELISGGIVIAVLSEFIFPEISKL
jgi:hypothetical protein